MVSRTGTSRSRLVAFRPQLLIFWAGWRVLFDYSLSGARHTMALEKRGVRIGIQVVLAVAIVVLAVILYQSITEPYEVIKRQRALTQDTRERMSHIRTAMVRHDRVHGRFPSTLDSLVMFVKQDSLLTEKQDSVFGEAIVPDSLPYSPRTGKRFELTVNDTSRVATYLLEDPDTGDRIGTVEPDVTRLNAASWE